MVTMSPSSVSKLVHRVNVSTKIMNISSWFLQPCDNARCYWTGLFVLDHKSQLVQKLRVNVSCNWYLLISTKRTLCLSQEPVAPFSDLCKFFGIGEIEYRHYINCCFIDRLMQDILLSLQVIMRENKSSLPWRTRSKNACSQNIVCYLGSSVRIFACHLAHSLWYLRFSMMIFHTMTRWVNSSGNSLIHIQEKEG